MAGPLPGDVWYIQTASTNTISTDEMYAPPRMWVKVTSPGYYGTFKIPEEPEPTSNELGEIAP